ncbi:MAG: hypothetical protein QOJ07_3303 [Thermoleophilaceae bacterium]|nr:hypothetical protein [Thermoleophilaceae bacterium]
MRRTGAVIAVLAGLIAAAPARAQTGSPPPYVPWTDVLPPLGSPDVQPGPVPNCRKASMKCVDNVIGRLRRARNRFGCDHRAVFADTYLLLTRQFKTTVKRNPRFFADQRWVETEDATFANFYTRMLADQRAGRPLPEAWQIAVDTAASGDANAAQDMLLGINAHVQRDMPYVLASVGLRTPDGTTRKPDHEAVNHILADAYEPIVRDIERRYDPVISVTNTRWSPIDDIAGLEAVQGWREGVWRNAERLLNAKTEADRQLVEQSIEQNAANWARMIATPQVPPGYRSSRDAYCRDHT